MQRLLNVLKVKVPVPKTSDKEIILIIVLKDVWETIRVANESRGTRETKVNLNSSILQQLRLLQEIKTLTFIWRGS